MDCDVPKKFVVSSQHQQRWSVLALSLMEVGIIHAEDKFDSVAGLVSNGMTRWFKSVTGALRFVQIDPTVHIVNEDLLDGVFFHDEEEEKPNQWFMSYTGNGVTQWITLEEGITALEAAHIGLGQTALALLTYGSVRSFLVHTPGEARDFLTNTCWYGESDQEGFLAMYDGEGEEMADMITPNSFDRSVGAKWVSDPKQVLDIDTLQQIANQGNGLASETAALLVSIKQSLDAKHEMPGMREMANGDWADSIYFSAYTRWNNDDAIEEAFDIRINDMNQWENVTDIMGVDSIPLTPEGVKEWVRRTENGLRLLAMVDQLLGLIGKTE
jgi:PRTRC genetic system protein F